MRIFVWLVLCVSIGLVIFPSSLLAQQVAPQTKKNVVKNFKADLNQYSAFGTDCTQKPRGDANCDTQINEFDLSIWQVEFSAINSPKRSDFNNDSVVNLLDYGIWRNTFFPAPKITQARDSKFLIDLSTLISNQIPITKLGLGTLGHFLDQLGQLEIRNYISTVYAQEAPSGGGEINSSSSFISGSGNGMVLNSLNGGNTQQLNFDAHGNPQNAAFYNTNGQSYAEVAFLQTGGTIINTEESGIPITISKTASGPIIENFKNPDGSLLAIKSWPTQASYDRNDPPLSVTMPGQGQTREVLNIQPNGDGILEKTDPLGNVLSRSQMRLNGTLVTEDYQNNILTQSNSQVGLSAITMDNNLGGKSNYMFFEGQLYAVVQTNGDRKPPQDSMVYISQPLNAEGNSWSFETIKNGTKIATETVSNPIDELNTNTPDPIQLIQNINYYISQSQNPNAVNFSDSFTTTTGIAGQIQKANQILTISQTQAPTVLGIIKEAYAQNAERKNEQESQAQGGYKTTTHTYTGTNLAEVMVVQTHGPGAGGGTAQTLLGTSESILSAGAQIPDIKNMDPKAAAEALATVNTTGPAPVPNNVSLDAISGTLPSVAAAPAPAEPGRVPFTPRTNIAEGLPTIAAVIPAAPAGPGKGGDPWDVDNRDKKDGGNNSEKASAVQAAAAAAAGRAATETPGTAVQRANAAKAEYVTAFNAQYEKSFEKEIGEDTSAKSFRDRSATFAAIQSYVSIYAPTITDWNSPSAINARSIAMRDLGITGISPIDVPRPGAAATSAPASAQSTGTAAQAAAATVPPPGPGQAVSNIPFSIGNLSGLTAQTYKDAAGNTIVTATFAGPNGQQNTFTQNLTTEQTTFTKDGSSFSAHQGHMTSISGAATLSPGTVFALDKSGDIVAVGSTSFIDADGRVQEGVGRTDFSKAEAEAWNAAARETAGGGGSPVQTGLVWDAAANGGSGGYTSVTSHVTADGFCFLPGTLISTPNGKKAIETLNPGDKVYSYNEKTKEKQISDFKELDINFVDEYLVINGQIKTTVYHPFYIVPKSRLLLDSRLRGNDKLETVRADELKIGDILQNEAGEYIPVYSIEKINAPKTTVYNLMNVTKNNNFFAEGILVHNYGAEPDASSTVDNSATGGDPNAGSGGLSDPGQSNSLDSGNSGGNDNFNNDTSSGSDANSSGADSSGW